MTSITGSPRSVVVISGSPSPTSKTAKVGEYAVEWLAEMGTEAQHIRVRDFSPAALLTGDLTDTALKAAVDAVAAADGIILATPTFKASFSGLLKAFLDVLPQYGLRDKTVLPVGTGGSMAHVLSLDYGLRPVVQSMRPKLIVPSVYLIDQDLKVENDRFFIEARSRDLFVEMLEEFEMALHNVSMRPERAPREQLLHAVG